MDDLMEHQRLKEEQEFWEDKERDTQRPKNGRPRDFAEPNPEMASPTNLGSSRDSAPLDAGIRPTDAPLFREPNKTKGAKKKKSNIGMLSAVALLVLGALGYQGYRMWQKSRDTLPTDTTAQLAPIVAGSALPPVLPATTEVAAPVDVIVPAAGEPVAAQSKPEPDAVTLALVEQNERLDRLEARLAEVIEGLRAQGYIIGQAGSNGQPLTPDAFAPRIVARPEPDRRAPVRRSKPKAPVAKALPPVTRQQLLSVDMWDGRPSVVLGNGDTANPRVKVMQPGDTFNGITLKTVDVLSQRATFSGGARSMSLDVSN